LHLVNFVPRQALACHLKEATMKTLIIAATLLAATVPAMAQTNVSITLGQPGFYGRIDLGDFARPPVFYQQPIIVERNVRYVGQPLYLRVPPGHMKNWSKHCAHYNACGQQVYFVRDEWYNNTYAPRYREEHHGHDRRDRGHERDDDGDRGHDNGHDNGNGHGNGHGHGKH
jgi:hypothetical protein